MPVSYTHLDVYKRQKQYLSITKKARERNQKVVRNAINSMVTEDMLDVFLELLDNISDETIKNYLYAVGQFKLPSDVDTPNTCLLYTSRCV